MWPILPCFHHDLNQAISSQLALLFSLLLSLTFWNTCMISPKHQYGFYIDLTRCTGCKTCQVSCKDNKSSPEGVNFRRVYEYAGGNWVQGENNSWQQNIFAYYLSVSCNHCADPACTKVCPSGAMHKRETDGLVVVDTDVCIGCKYCDMACPYGAPQYDEQKGHMTKCDGCFDRLAIGKNPICVDACPLRAIEFGPIDELREKYGDLADVAPLPNASVTQPSLVIKLSKNAQPATSQLGNIINQSEV